MNFTWPPGFNASVVLPWKLPPGLHGLGDLQLEPDSRLGGLESWVPTGPHSPSGRVLRAKWLRVDQSITKFNLPPPQSDIQVHRILCIEDGESSMHVRKATGHAHMKLFLWGTRCQVAVSPKLQSRATCAPWFQREVRKQPQPRPLRALYPSPPSTAEDKH